MVVTLNSHFSVVAVSEEVLAVPMLMMQVLLGVVIMSLINLVLFLVLASPVRSIVTPGQGFLGLLNGIWRGWLPDPEHETFKLFLGRMIMGLDRNLWLGGITLLFRVLIHFFRAGLGEIGNFSFFEEVKVVLSDDHLVHGYCIIGSLGINGGRF